MKLHWEQRNKSDPIWVCDRFKIEWAGRKPNPFGCYVLYDSATKTHYHGFINYGRAQDLAQAIVDDNVFKIGLVACCGEKRTHPDAARELYQSDLFKKAAAYCEKNYDRWYILSAMHGMVRPDAIIEPYDKKLTASDGNEFAAKVMAHLPDEPGNYGRTLFYAHAGKYYTDPLLPFVPMAFPMRGLGIGEQLAWYKERLKDEIHRRDDGEVRLR